MKIYALLQTSSDLEIDDSVYQYGYKTHTEAVSAAKELIANDQNDYRDDTEIHINRDDNGEPTSFELWTLDGDSYLESVVIEEVIIK